MEAIVGIMKVIPVELTTLMAIVIQVVILEATAGVTQAVVVTVEVEEAVVIVEATAGVTQAVVVTVEVEEAVVIVEETDVEVWR